MVNRIPVLDWRTCGDRMVAWVNGTDFYSLKPVCWVGQIGQQLEWELRIEHAATGTHELIGVYIKPDLGVSAAREHVGDTD